MPTGSLAYELTKTKRIKLSCTRCARDYIYPFGSTKSLCPACYFKQTRHDRKRKLIEMMGGKCARCGYDRCAGSLHFHHTANDKEAGITNMLKSKRKWQDIVAEAQKCELICANCHGEIHWGA